MISSSLHSSFVKRNSLGNGGSIRTKESYSRKDIGVPFFLNEADIFFIVPTASALDEHFEALLSCEDFTRYALILGSVVSRLKALGHHQTLQKLKKAVTRDPQRVWIGFADDHMTQNFTTLSTLVWLSSYVPFNRFSVLSENIDFRTEAKNQLSQLSISSTRDFFLHFSLPEPIQRHSRIVEELKPTPVTSARIKGALKCINSRIGFVGVDALVVECNRAIHGDIVEIEPCSLIEELEEGEEEPMLKSKKTFKVVGIVERDIRRRKLICTLDVKQAEALTPTLICVPMDDRFPKVVLTSKLGSSLLNKRFVVEILDWPNGQRYPSARFVKTIGNALDLRTESSCILVETELDQHDLPFSVDALEELPDMKTFWMDPALVQEDLRNRKVVSIDPIGCQDIDDAISVMDIDEESFELGVHIADVSRFVKSGGALDREASIRATSVYLEERRLDMLPALLCEDLCSLKPNIDRFAVSALFQVNRRTWEIQGRARFVKSLVHSRYALAYQQAQELVDGKIPEVYPSKGWTGKYVNPHDHDWLRRDISTLREFSRRRKTRRSETGGAINLGSSRPELSFVSEVEDSVALLATAHLEMHETIAELMILANEAVANRLLELHPTTALLRMHPPSVDALRFADCIEYCQRIGIHFDCRSNATIAASLQTVREQCDESTVQWMESLTTRAMAEAQYFCAGTQPRASYFHFGLGLSAYTHFTSPIRRYADVVVARQLFQTLEATESDSLVTTNPSNNAPGFSDVPSVEEEGDLDWAKMLGGESDEEETKFQPPPPSPPVVSVMPNKMQDFHTHSSAQQVQDICNHINFRHRSAKEASFRSSSLFLAMYLKNQCNTTAATPKFSGILSRISSTNVWCFVPLFDLRIKIPLDSTMQTQTTKGNETLRIGSILELHLLDHVDLELSVQWKEEGLPPGPRIPPICGKIVISSQTTTIGSKGDKKALVSNWMQELARLAPVKSLLDEPCHVKTLYSKLLEERVKIGSSDLSTALNSNVVPKRKGRICLGGFQPPPTTSQQRLFEEEEEDTAFAFSRKSGASKLSEKDIKIMEREVMRRTEKLQNEKFESRRSRRMKKGE